MQPYGCEPNVIEVAWMLLKPTEIVHPRSHTPQPERTEAGDAWILLGGLDTALYQAGILEVVIDVLRRPAIIYGGGVCAINAVLARGRAAIEFRRGWEMLRSHHLLASFALAAHPILRSMRNGRDDSEDALKAIASASGADRSIALSLLTEGRYRDAATANGVDFGALVEAVGHKHLAPHALSSALDAALGRAHDRIYLLGIDEELLAGQDVVCTPTGGDERRVDTIVRAGGRRSSVFGYLLPALGAPDRLMAAGRAAAREWVHSRGAP